MRQYTIWETLTDTAREYKDKLYPVIDEAHRGTNMSAKAKNSAQSIMQKFIMRSKIGKLTDGRRLEYERLSDATDRPQDVEWHFPVSLGFYSWYR